MPFGKDAGRRDFLKTLGVTGLASAAQAEQESPSEKKTRGSKGLVVPGRDIEYPRKFSGAALKMISFPLGGIGAGSIGLGGRGQLRDWEIFNKPDKGNSPQYAFASLWVKPKGGEATAHVLESRIETPYQGQDGLGSQNAPGLSRLQGATFTGEFPRARIDFEDDRLPVKVSIEAGTPFIPLDADASGLPIAVLRYRISNPSKTSVTASVALSIENPVKPAISKGGHAFEAKTVAANELRATGALKGLFMTNPGIPASDVESGTFAMAILNATDGQFTSLRGWPAGRWWNSPLLFWDDFSSDGELGPEAERVSPVGAICLQQEIQSGSSAEFAFVLAWHFPNRTPARCGWTAPKGYENSVIGNWYAKQFPDAWAVAEYAAAHLTTLEARTERFVSAFRDSTLPAAIKEAASANLSTLVTTTCFRTADGEFHAFEGSNDHVGCCFGNCTHVWNYETSTAHLFPSLSNSLRRAAFGYSMDERGGMHFRQLLPDGLERFNTIAADGQMGQVMKVFIDWQLSGDPEFLKEFWPKVKQAMAFAWIPGGWDANRDGVMEGVQHNTYDVEFYGPNPMCGLYYLGALRAAEEMARAMHDESSAGEYRRLFDSGKAWVDRNLFTGSYFIQKVEGRPANDIAPGLRSGMGTEDTEDPQYQVGAGCLVDQLIGQYLADVAGLGPLVDPQHVRETLESNYRYNHKPNLYDHNCVQRTFALNDEAAMVICDYTGAAERPKIPFPYYAEVMTGFEYSTASLMLYEGMFERGLECISDIRRRYDGERRNPWDEAECGHHYARAMAAWSGLLATSGFRYRGQDRTVHIARRVTAEKFRSFWSSGTGWGTFHYSGNEFSIVVIEGHLVIQQLQLDPFGGGSATRVELGHEPVAHRVSRAPSGAIIVFQREQNLQPDQTLRVASTQTAE